GSTKPIVPTYQEHLEDIIGVLEKTVAPPIVLISSSVVSMIATELARLRPQWIKALVIVGFGQVEESRSWWRRYKEASRDLDHFVSQTYYQPPVSIPPPIRSLLLDAFSRPAYTGFLNGHDVEAMAKTFDSINIPTLFVAGENDCFISKPDVERAAAR